MGETEAMDDTEDAVDTAYDDLLVGESLSAKQEERARLNAEIEAFLAAGGQINEIPPNVVADPPKKPVSNYGGQPI